MRPLRDSLRPLKSLTSTPPSFDPSAAPDNPLELFVRWFTHAVEAGQVEPHAMTLSTVDADGVPDARVLILKDLTDDGWWFASSSASAKGVELTANPVAALTFYWPGVGRSVRVRGTVTRGPEEDNARDFSRRGLGARAVALGSPQSQPLVSHDESEAAIEEAARELDAHPELVSPTWTLWCVCPESVEFWQSDAERRHQRLRYSSQGQSWSTTLLWP
ncbi:pyridoxine/pyridoxamine 5'-phosphate oxidase [Agreia sp. Leaf335]|uniref:pyridoxine/pyridoxamine 5'-phosphate oxidase n=1 Tax=Agreia sp. Leaf335 TaxID=1736340 RepID=UPI000AA64113|nr:pyridoxal 5'-phosphate synthase [Agreia sp. Leaf335]